MTKGRARLPHDSTRHQDPECIVSDRETRSAKCAEPLVVGGFHSSAQEAVGDSGSASGLVLLTSSADRRSSLRWRFPSVREPRPTKVSLYTNLLSPSASEKGIILGVGTKILWLR